MYFGQRAAIVASTRAARKGSPMDNEKLKKARGRRGQIVTEQRAILAAAPDGILAKGSEDDVRFDKLTSEDETLQRTIPLEGRAARLPDPPPDQPEPPRLEPRGEDDQPAPREKRTATPEYRQAFTRFLATGSTRGVQIVEERATADGLQADADTAGGFAVAPQQFVNTLIKFIDNEVFLRQRATVQRVDSAASLGAPSLDANPEDGDWTQELTTVDFDTQMEFGKRELRPHELTKGIKVSRKLLARSALPIESIVTQRLGYKFAVTEETAFMTGNGVNRPLGLFTASADGISTSRDVTAASTTAFDADDMSDVLYNCKLQYQGKGERIFHRDGVKD